MTATEALAHPYLEEGRLRYHSCMCKCCVNAGGGRQYCPQFEPACRNPFSYSFEEELTSVYKVKGKMIIKTSQALSAVIKTPKTRKDPYP